ncbi:MAG: acyltransferase [Candidatus Delongbacteria bacterium]|jgi:acetyltransferase-like isoleucine patch superfamily enzyme|nr:acyltransferase [Candidatus Delongbacteria bacterium]
MLDISGKIFNFTRRYYLRYNSMISTILTKILLFFKGIKTGKGLHAWGVPIIVRKTNSEIIIGDNCSFRSNDISNLVGINRKCIISTLRDKAEIVIGDNSGFSGTVIAAAGSIRIGDDVLCGANTTITDYDWHGIDPDKRNFPPDPKPIIIEDNVWLGLNCVVLKGVTIGKNSVIGADSVVTKDIPSNVIAVGNPCKVIKEIEAEGMIKS